MVWRSSFSQEKMFSSYPRQWYLKYIMKLPEDSDMSYADGGTVLHKVIEDYYNGDLKDIDAIKNLFEKQWKKYDLDNALWLRDKVDVTLSKKMKSEYWLMVLNGINLNVEMTHQEMKIYYPDVVGYLDGVNVIVHHIRDWKSSKRTKINEDDYRLQLKFYAYLYYRKFEVLPTDLCVHYLRYVGSKGELHYIPTMEDVLQMEVWHFTNNASMEKMSTQLNPPPICKNCSDNTFCRYKDYCMNENKEELKFEILVRGNTLQLRGPISSVMHNKLDEIFSYELKDAYFIKKHNKYANTTIRFWNQRNNTLPLAFLSRLVKNLSDYATFKKRKLIITADDKRQFNKKIVSMPQKFLSGITLRDYQNDAVDTFLKNKFGILELGTGAGKTEIAIEVIRRLQMKTLFVVDKVELLLQTVKRLKDALGIEIGIIRGKQRDTHCDVCVATIQTINRNIDEFSIYLSSIRLAVMDECHKVAAKSYFNLSKKLINTEFRLGISATAKRNDGNNMMIDASIGQKCFDLSSKKLIEKGWLMKPKIYFIKNFISKERNKEKLLNTHTGLIKETPKYATHYNEFVLNNVERNRAIINVADKLKEKKVLILVKLVDHGMMLESLIPGSRYLHGGSKPKERKEIFDNFVGNKLNIMIATISIFAEGIDIPKLDNIINATANRSDVKTIQVLGRILRKLEGKTVATYYDFIDDVHFLRKASLARRRILQSEGHDVKTIDYKKHNF